LVSLGVVVGVEFPLVLGLYRPQLQRESVNHACCVSSWWPFPGSDGCKLQE
jgi:hypothetical protein